MAEVTAAHRFTMTQETIDSWAHLSTDMNPLHVSEQYARSTPFGGTIAHGHYSLAAMLELLQSTVGPPWLEGGTVRDVRFRSPVRPGRTYDVTATPGDPWRVEVRDAEDGTLAAEAIASPPPE